MDESEMSQRNENSRVMAGGLRQKMLRKHGGNGKNRWDKPESRPDWKTLEEGEPLRSQRPVDSTSRTKGLDCNSLSRARAGSRWRLGVHYKTWNKGQTLGCLRGMEKEKNEGEDTGKMGGKEETNHRCVANQQSHLITPYHAHVRRTLKWTLQISSCTIMSRELCIQYVSVNVVDEPLSWNEVRATGATGDIQLTFELCRKNFFPDARTDPETPRRSTAVSAATSCPPCLVGVGASPPDTHIQRGFLTDTPSFGPSNLMYAGSDIDTSARLARCSAPLVRTVVSPCADDVLCNVFTWTGAPTQPRCATSCALCATRTTTSLGDAGGERGDALRLRRTGGRRDGARRWGGGGEAGSPHGEMRHEDGVLAVGDEDEDEDALVEVRDSRTRCDDDELDHIERILSRCAHSQCIGQDSSLAHYHSPTLHSPTSYRGLVRRAIACGRSRARIRRLALWESARGRWCMRAFIEARGGEAHGGRGVISASKHNSLTGGGVPGSQFCCYIAGENRMSIFVHRASPYAVGSMGGHWLLRANGDPEASHDD
ncbi:hypothetical protein B0H13DRAFT_2285155 [Mycena leptocephala]|nr:hypothetical protein B0H13DRAFT_2285155 [Mycena leptocephala]